MRFPIWPALGLISAILASLALAAFTHADPPIQPPIVAPLSVHPAWHQVILDPGAVRSSTISLHAPPGTRLLSAQADCSCVRVDLRLPIEVGPSGRLDLPLRLAQTGVEVRRSRLRIGERALNLTEHLTAAAHRRPLTTR